MTIHRPARMADQVTRVLRDRIVDGTLPAGSRIDIGETANELGVSPTPVREALVQLESLGLLTREPYRGAVVVGIDLNRLEEVTALRIDLEGRAAELGVPRLSDADLERMREVLGQLERGSDDAAFSLGLFNELNREFHSVIYRASDSPTLVRLIDLLGAEADRMRLHVDVRAPFAEAFHRQILAGCERRDAPAVAAATRQHLLEAYIAMRHGDDTISPGILADVLSSTGTEARHG
ncbi:GntR family transcriptional regulator [Pseudolysinimonas yzui]|uniref:GntR family transcriptional regulator n=1 Tax=Pseudolysinimonas yzui TaxID=2708254 RepID=A0A8J3M0Y2_9MICO|nr:GntR family transcriptional regulator [Pseudolysinimonas yzui]GHF18991.1 GntR family transcriptional regulator [Pseudolysinimonas yzui]